MSIANFLKEFCYSWCREVGPGDRFVVVVVVFNICRSTQPFYKVSITTLVRCLNTLISASVVN